MHVRLEIDQNVRDHRIPEKAVPQRYHASICIVNGESRPVHAGLMYENQARVVAQGWADFLGCGLTIGYVERGSHV